MGSPANMGAQNDIDGYEVQPNQKKEIAKIGEAYKHKSKRYSGGTGAGANCLLSFSYSGFQYRM